MSIALSFCYWVQIVFLVNRHLLLYFFGIVCGKIHIWKELNKMALNKTTAEKMLYQAYEEALKGARPQTRFVRFIDSIIDNTHKTFKYILFTALLSKATDSSINPLCLQAGSSLRGAYDARTICHNVIVPFEMSVLEKALGGSNEPFLNKPARFPELSKTNPVRRGNDQDLLNILCDNLPQVRSSKSAIYTQIGNAVPCKLAEAVAASVIDVCINGTTYDVSQKGDEQLSFL